jgi:serine protease
MKTYPRSRALCAPALALVASAVVLTFLHPSAGPRTRDAQVSDTLWTTADASVYADPADVVAAGSDGVPTGAALRLTTIRNDDGEPKLRTATVNGVRAAQAAVKDAQRDLDVVAVAVDSKVNVDEDVTATAVSNDSMRSQQWALNTLRGETVWKHASGAGTVVAVVDTGVTASHEDLKGQVRSGAEFLGGGAKFSTGNGQTDEHGHGTHVAGIIAAVKGNKKGIAGLAPTATVLPVRVMDAAGSGWNSDVAAGIIYATNAGADVISLSLSGSQDGATKTAVEYAVNRGVLVVASAGNARQKGNAVAYPAAYPGVLAVASTDQSGSSSSFSSTGSYVDIAAPGGNILSTLPSGYGLKSGTSMAAPYVAAAAALVRDASAGKAGATEIAAALTGTATDRGPVGYDNEFGSGALNPLAAVCQYLDCGSLGTSPSPVPLPPTETPTGPGVSDPPSAAPDPGSVDASGLAADTRLLPLEPASYIWYGKKATIAARLYNDDTNMLLAGQIVTIKGYEGSKLVFSKNVRTDSSGRARLSATLYRTTTVKATSLASKSYKAASVTVGQFRVLPTVRAAQGKRSASITIRPALRQTVKFQQKTASGWKTRKTVTSSKSGVAKATHLQRGTWRIYVSRKARVDSITTAAFVVR